MASNPFTNSGPIQRKVKLMLFGAEKTGKTTAALTFPNPAVIDTERGTEMYHGREGVPDFARMTCKTLEEYNAAITYMKTEGHKQYETLIIDPITIIYDLVREEQIAKVEKRGKDFGGTDYGKVNLAMRTIYMDLLELPCHVVVTAHEAIDYEGTPNGGLKKIGIKIDADKSAGYPFDFIINMNKNHSGTFIGGRIPQAVAKTLKLPADLTGHKLASVTFNEFAKIAEVYSVGQTLEVPQEKPVDLEDMTIKANAKAFVGYWQDQGINQDFLKQTLDVEFFTNWKQGRKLADELIANTLEMTNNQEEEQRIPA